jgi:hypothetical protein
MLIELTSATTGRKLAIDHELIGKVFDEKKQLGGLIAGCRVVLRSGRANYWVQEPYGTVVQMIQQAQAWSVRPDRPWTPPGELQTR